MGMTMAERVLARTSGRAEVAAGESVTASADVLMCHEALTMCASQLRRVGVERLAHPERVHVVLDHFFPAPTVRLKCLVAWSTSVPVPISAILEKGTVVWSSDEVFNAAHVAMWLENGIAEKVHLAMGTDATGKPAALWVTAEEVERLQGVVLPRKLTATREGATMTNERGGHP